MALSKSTITGRVPLPTDENLQFAELTFALSGLDTEGADVLPGGISTRIVLIDSDIPPGFELWQNMAGLHGTHYRVLARWTVKDRDGIRDQYADLGVIQIGSDPSYTLADLINNGVAPAIGTFWSAITQAQYDAVIQSAADAAASAVAAAASATAAALYDGPRVDTFAQLMALTAVDVAVGQYVQVRSIGAWYRRVASGGDLTGTPSVLAWEISVDQSAVGKVRTAYIEQFISGFFGRGMLAGETINVTTEQAIAVSAAAGAASITVTDATHMLVGGCVTILHDDGLYHTYFVAAKAGNVLSIRPGLRSAVSTASQIERTWFNRAHAGKFYIRGLAQRVARSTEFDAAMPNAGRVLFSNFSSNPNTPEDTLTAVGGASISYFAASPLGSSGNTDTPVRFAIGRTALITPAGVNQGAETPLFAVPEYGDCIAKIMFACPSVTPSCRIEVIGETAAVLATYDIPGGIDQTIHQIYTVPFNARAARFVKIRVTVTAGVLGSFMLDQIDVFEAPITNDRLITKRGAVVVCLGDSWVAGDLGGSLQREPLTQQLALELPTAKVVNAGIGGNKVWEMLARFDADVAVHSPDYVVVCTGTNEAYNPASGTFDPNSIDYFMLIYQQLISRIIGIGARPIIIGNAGLAETDGAFTAWLLNDRARSYAQRFMETMSRRPYVLGQKSGLEAYRTDATLTAGATPSVAGLRTVNLTYAAPTTITNLTDGVTGQIVTLTAKNGNVTLAQGVFKLHGSASLNLPTDSTITLQHDDTTVGNSWFEISRSIAGTSSEVTFTTGATPSVAGASSVVLNYAAAETITNFTGGVKNQVIQVRTENGNATLASGAAAILRLQGLVNVTPTADSVITLLKIDPTLSTRWIEVSRSIK